jgi:branched-chain amino acid transport system permease protein
MGEALQYLLNGLTLGGIYALVALGFYIMWEASKAANFTHGDVYMLGAVMAVVLVERGMPLLVSAALALMLATALGALIERLLVRPFNAEPNAIGWMLTTIAAGIMIESATTHTYGSLGRALPSPLAHAPLRFGGAGVYPQELLLPVVAIAAMFGLEAFYRRTTLGRAMRAVAFNRPSPSDGHQPEPHGADRLCAGGCHRRARRHPHRSGRPSAAHDGGTDRAEGVRDRYHRRYR